jgi:benzoate-CoA ligase
MPELSSADHSVSPPTISIPRQYNAAYDLIERNLRAGRGDKLAYIDDFGSYTYSDLAQRVDRCAAALLQLGLQPEQRVFLCLQDTIDFPTAFLGSIKAGLVPVAANTLLTTADYDYMLRDSRACALIVSGPLLPQLEPLRAAIPTLKHWIVAGSLHGSQSPAGTQSPAVSSFTTLLARSAGPVQAAETCPDDACFWLYSSGSTGAPKGTVHVHGSLIQTAELYGRAILGIRPDDVVFSAAKLFFAYGLGNALTFPLCVGATTVLMAERPTPEAVFARLRQHRPTVFCGVPTLYSSLLANPALPSRAAVPLRACVSAGEALPREIGERWRRHFDVDILDGIGSTEMLHIFLSNRPGAVNYGTTGSAVPGYQLRLVDDECRPVPTGEIGELQVAGPTAATGYWNNREKTRHTFCGPWLRTGDKYYVNESGCYVHAGRTDDMLKVSGIYVSPVEVEAALLSHPAVLEAAVIGKADDGDLVKPLAFVVLNTGFDPTDSLASELKQWVKSRLAPYKYPRWIQFSAALPKTATGKIQRFRLRDLAATVADAASLH